MVEDTVSYILLLSSENHVPTVLACICYMVIKADIIYQKSYIFSRYP